MSFLTLRKKKPTSEKEEGEKDRHVSESGRIQEGAEWGQFKKKIEGEIRGLRH